MSEADTCPVKPARAAANAKPYGVPRTEHPIDLWLDSNEGVGPTSELLEEIARSGIEPVRRYPDKTALEGQIAERFDVEPRQVIVTAGGDDALERGCRATLEPGRQLVLPVPSFEMLPRYAHTIGADVIEVDWPRGPYPTDAVCAHVTPRTGAIAIVSPNNPTGAVATADDLARLSAAAQHALLLVDLAYAEFAEEDLTAVALTLPNAIVVRSFSKAWGLAGMRVGYALGPARIVDWLRAVGGPYPTSSCSLLLAACRFATGQSDVTGTLMRIERERAELYALLIALQADALPSQANFVFAHYADADRVRIGLAERGIAVRGWPDRPGLQSALRITCPGDERAFGRLCAALRAIHAECPEAFARSTS